MPGYQIARQKLLILVCLLGSLAGFAPAQVRALPRYPPPGSKAQLPQPDAAAEAQMVNLINQARAQEGSPALTVDDRLTQAARKHTQRMVENSALSHQFPGEPSLQIRFADENLPSDREGENVGMAETMERADEAFMESPPHRANILDPDFNVVGVGVFRSGNNLYVTEDFARRLPQYSEPEAEAAAEAAIERYERSHGQPTPVRKPFISLRHIACDMALNDSLNLAAAAHLPGVHDVFAWTAGDPEKLPNGIDRSLSSGLPAGYSLGACFAPSVSHPGGLYWLVLVSY